LDLASIAALGFALKKHEGTVLFLTHDDDLLDEVATRVWRLTPGHPTFLAIVALAAMLAPSFQAARVSPLKALRDEG
jgi:ATPase subunit of ABC transporter with duplicated ATPase domains